MTWQDDPIRDDLATVAEAARFCPVHHMPDCSPLLNGCSRPDHLHAALARLESRLEQADKLAEAATIRLARGHDDTCDWALDRSAGGTLQGYPCNCGHETLHVALAEWDGDAA